MSIIDGIKISLNKNKTLVKNFSSLSLLQISQYILPLITFPYLVRVLGPNGYGLIAFATAFVGYFTVLTDYGFNLSATKEVSINRANNQKISDIFNSVFAVKFILFFFSVIIFIPILLLFSKFYSNLNIYLISFFSVFGTLLFPIWFFQGYEKMGYITIISILVKVFWVIGVFIFIHSKNDILTLVILNSASSIITGLIGLFIAINKFSIKLYFPTIEMITHQFKEGWHYFLSTVSISLYTITNVFILGLFANDTVVGYFASADKIRQAFQNLTSIAGRTIYPHLSLEFSKSRKSGFKFLKKYTALFGSIVLVISVSLFLFSEEIVMIVLGEDYLNSILPLKIISFLPFIIFFSNVAGIQVMVNLGFKESFSKILIYGAIINLVISFIIVPAYFEIGTSISVLITEIFVTLSMILFLRKQKINIFSEILNNEI